MVKIKILKAFYKKNENGYILNGGQNYSSSLLLVLFSFLGLVILSQEYLLKFGEIFPPRASIFHNVTKCNLYLTHEQKEFF